MKQKIMAEINDFEELINRDGYFIDKTELIYELSEKNWNEVTLITRPRGFGKTISLRMLESFFDIRRRSGDVFKNLHICENHPECCRKWMNQYPVIFISFREVDGPDFDTAFRKMKEVIADLCRKNADLLNQMDEMGKSDFLRLMSETGKVSDICFSLNDIMRIMKSVYGKRVILLIDDYDMPLVCAKDSKDSEYYLQMQDLMRGLLSVSLKSNEYLEFAIMTGNLWAVLGSDISGVNNISCYSVLSHRYSSYFGFMEEEVSEMLEECGLSSRMELIRKWYGGYIFGDTELFNPRDVMNYLSDVICKQENQPKNYWEQTGLNTILDEFVDRSRFNASWWIEELLNGGTVTEDICEVFSYDRILESERNLRSVLLMMGYVSKADKTLTRRVRLRIPNQEIYELFIELDNERFSRLFDKEKSDEFIAAI